MVKRKAILFFIAIIDFAFHNAPAQNLLPNPSFEMYSPKKDTAIIATGDSKNSDNSINLRYDIFSRYCLNWYNTNQLFSLRNRCWDSLECNPDVLPHLSDFENSKDTSRLTHSGNSSVTLLVEDDLIRTNIYCFLIDTLCKGCRYKISYYIYVTEESTIIYDNFGLLFNLPVDTMGWDERSVLPFYLKNEKPLIKGKWQKIEFNYTAHGYERLISFGNYNIEKKARKLKSRQRRYAMRIYIDDFSIEQVQTNN